MDIRNLIGKKMLYFDGGLGTLLQAQGLQPGEEPERWNIDHPDVVENVHFSYYEAGCHIVTTDSLNCNVLNFPDDGTYSVENIAKAAVSNAKRARDRMDAIDGGAEPPMITLRLSWQYMFSADFMNRVKFLQQRYSIPSGLIEIVAPEGQLSTESFNSAMTILQELQNLGFHVDIDSYLAQCAISEAPKDLPAGAIMKNPDYSGLVKAREKRKLNAPMPPEDFETLFTDKKK